MAHVTSNAAGASSGGGNGQASYDQRPGHRQIARENEAERAQEYAAAQTADERSAARAAERGLPTDERILLELARITENICELANRLVSSREEASPSREETQQIAYSGDAESESGQLLSENPTRLGYTIFNDGNAPLYILTSDDPTGPDHFKLALQPGEYYETLFLASDTYAGPIRYAWGDAAQAGDVAHVTEVYVDPTAAPVAPHGARERIPNF